MRDAPRIFYFWTDLETTGLFPDFDAILEIAWLITDDQLRMVTPLRQRFTLLNPPPPYLSHVGPPPVDHFVSQLGEFKRDDWNVLPSVVKTMHDKSHLHRDWEDTHPYSIITKSNVIEQAIFDDLASLRFEAGVDKLVLSGAGVGHFEHRVFPLHFPKLYPASSIDRDVMWLYYPYDTSTAVRVLDPRMMVALQEKAAKKDAPWAILAAEQDVDNEVDRLLIEEGQARFNPDAIVPHRAADDVVASLIHARILRRAAELVNADAVG